MREEKSKNRFCQVMQCWTHKFNKLAILWLCSTLITYLLVWERCISSQWPQWLSEIMIWFQWIIFVFQLQIIKKTQISYYSHSPLPYSIFLIPILQFLVLFLHSIASIPRNTHYYKCTEVLLHLKFLVLPFSILPLAIGKHLWNQQLSHSSSPGHLTYL